LGWSRLLRKKLLNKKPLKTDALERALESIERNAKMQAELIGDLLDISRNIAGKMRLKLQSVELPGIINAAIDTVRSDKTSRG
jgi:signal transduction histidine kinase